jgi:hypothetical protein
MLTELIMLDMGRLTVNIDILLFGNDNLSVEINTFIFSCVQKYINTPSATKKRIYVHVEVHNVDNCQ